MISYRHTIVLAGILTGAGFCLLNPFSGVVAQPIVTEATMEARLVLDSSGCPEAIDLWLFATPDTIMGLELVLSWDSPDIVQFVRAPDTAASGEDTVEAKNPAPGYDAEFIKTGGDLGLCQGTLPHQFFGQDHGDRGFSQERRGHADSGRSFGTPLPVATHD